MKKDIYFNLENLVTIKGEMVLKKKAREASKGTCTKAGEPSKETCTKKAREPSMGTSTERLGNHQNELAQKG